MEAERQTTALTDLIAGVKTEMELLYHVEKEISSLKESVESFKTVKEEVEKYRKEKERMDKILKNIRRIALAVIVFSAMGVAVITMVSCDVLFPDFESIFTGTDDGEVLSIEGTAWESTDNDAPFLSIEFSNDGRSCTALTSYNLPVEGSVVSSLISFEDGSSYSFEMEGSSLILKDDSRSFSYRLIST